MRPPRLTAIRVFEVAARHLNFGSAATELHVTQGAVAQSIRGLEADLGLQLFTRLPRGVALTDAGRRYHAGIAKGLAVIDRATEDLRAGVNALTISVPPSFASKWLVRRLPYFLERHPGLDVRTIATESVIDFQSQRIDVAVRQGADPSGGGRAHSGGLVSQELAAIERIIVCSPDLLSSSKGEQPVEWYCDQSLIEDGHKHWEQVFAEHDLSPRGTVLGFNQSALAIDAAIAGQGFAIVPRLIALEDLKAGRLHVVKTLPSDEAKAFWLLFSKEEAPNSVVRAAFVDWLLTQVQEPSISGT